MTFSVPLVLASRSPRRNKLLLQLGFSFSAVPADVPEDIADDETLPAQVRLLALRKAEAVAVRNPESLVIGADTIVVKEGHALGKPASSEAAVATLKRLSAAQHTVLTGIALVYGSRIVTALETTSVTFGKLSDEEIIRYVSTGSPLDKAGAYGIQDDMGALFVESIHGCYYNVVGLPLRRLYVMLTQHFADLITG